MTLATDIHDAKKRGELKRFLTSRVKVKVKVIRNHLSLSSLLFQLLYVQTCECYIVEAYISTVWSGVSLVLCLRTVSHKIA